MDVHHQTYPGLKVRQYERGLIHSFSRFLWLGPGIFNQRLSFQENFVFLQQLTKEDLSKAVVYDLNKKLFLDDGIPLKEFRISYFMLLELFT